MPSELELEGNVMTAISPRGDQGKMTAFQQVSPENPIKTNPSIQEVSTEPMPRTEAKELKGTAAVKLSEPVKAVQQAAAQSSSTNGQGAALVNPPPGFGDSPVKQRQLIGHESVPQPEDLERNRSTESLDRGVRKQLGGHPRKDSSTASSVATTTHAPLQSHDDHPSKHAEEDAMEHVGQEYVLGMAELE